MLKSHNHSISKYSQPLWLTALLLICLPAQNILASEITPDWSSVVKISFTNPETNLKANCSGVLINETTAITSASCLLAEETAKQSRTAQVCANRTANKPCLNTLEIMTHSNYLGTQGVKSANNLAYLKLRGRFNLKKNGIRIHPELTPQEFQQVSQNPELLKKTYWVNHDRQGLRSTEKNNFRGVIAPLEYDFLDKHLSFEGHNLKLGNHFKGAPVFVDYKGQTKLLGLLSGLTPDRTVHYYPEVNPCDEDPIIVRYPNAIMNFQAEIAPYPVAACGMQGFQASSAYTALACKRMQRANNVDNNIEEGSAVAMRQKAQNLASGDKAKTQIVKIYQHLNEAIASKDIKASELLAEIFLQGELVPQDKESAEELLRDPDGNLVSNYAHWLTAKELLHAYNDEDFRSINPDLDEQLMTHLKVAADSGYAEAQYYLGRMHQFGVASKPSNRTAYKWFAQAAMQGYSKAQFQLGTMWIDGRGVRSYPEVGLYWIRQAAARGYIKANNYLALNKGQYKIDNALSEYEMEYNDS